MDAVVRRVFQDKGMRFIFSTRSKLPQILDSVSGKPMFGAESGYVFVPGKDELVREGAAGYVVSYGDALYRALDAVERLKRDHGIVVGLINKSTLNVVDEEMLSKIGASKHVSLPSLSLASPLPLSHSRSPPLLTAQVCDGG